ncbi:MAG: hypothetical protein WAW00_00005, partial [Candidatus Moraniibacteriota bacterium]
MSAETKKPGVPIEELLKRVAAAAEAQADKFTQPVAEGADPQLESKPVAEPIGASVDASIATVPTPQKVLGRRRREGKHGKPRTAAESTKSAVPVAAPAHDAMQSVSPSDQTNADERTALR